MTKQAESPSLLTRGSSSFRDTILKGILPQLPERRSAGANDPGRQQVRSEDQKGVLARSKSWIDKNRGFFWVCVSIVAVFSLVCLAYPDLNPGGTFVSFLGCLLIAYLLRELTSRQEKLLIVRNVLLDIAFQECRCKPDSIIVEAPGAPELVSKPIGKGHCHVCKCRGLLEERFPGAIEELMQERLNAFEFEESYIPEDLAVSYITPEALTYIRERRLDRVGPERFVPLTFIVGKVRK
jgi:hypothetical protein